MASVGPFLAAAVVLQLQATPSAADAWSEEKCRRYREIWSGAIRAGHTVGIGQPFLDAHAAFLAAGCTTPALVCPTTPQELALANTLSLMAFNQGLGGTFLPFGCPR